METTLTVKKDGNMELEGPEGDKVIFTAMTSMDDSHRFTITFHPRNGLGMTNLMLHAAVDKNLLIKLETKGAAITALQRLREMLEGEIKLIDESQGIDETKTEDENLFENYYSTKSRRKNRKGLTNSYI